MHTQKNSTSERQFEACSNAKITERETTEERVWGFFFFSQLNYMVEQEEQSTENGDVGLVYTQDFVPLTLSI